MLENQYFNDEGVSQHLATGIANVPGYDPVIKQINEKPKSVGVEQIKHTFSSRKQDKHF